MSGPGISYKEKQTFIPTQPEVSISNLGTSQSPSSPGFILTWNTELYAAMFRKTLGGIGGIKQRIINNKSVLVNSRSETDWFP